MMLSFTIYKSINNGVPDTIISPKGMGKKMNKITINALEGMIQSLFESAVSNIQDVINETDEIEYFDGDKLMEEANYIDNLQGIKRQLDFAKENDEIEYLEPNLKFLKGDFTKDDLAEMVDESEVDVIWNMIHPTKVRKRKAISESINKFNK
jgi:hypothetical protein